MAYIRDMLYMRSGLFVWICASCRLTEQTQWATVAINLNVWCLVAKIPAMEGEKKNCISKCRPIGETKKKCETADWLLFASIFLSFFLACTFLRQQNSMRYFHPKQRAPEVRLYWSNFYSSKFVALGTLLCRCPHPFPSHKHFFCVSNELSLDGVGWRRNGRKFRLPWNSIRIRFSFYRWNCCWRFYYFIDHLTLTYTRPTLMTT